MFVRGGWPIEQLPLGGGGVIQILQVSPCWEKKKYIVETTLTMNRIGELTSWYGILVSCSPITKQLEMVINV